MPRIRQKAEEYAQEDFLNEIGSRCVWAGIKTNEELGNAIGVSANTVGNFKRDPGRIRIDVLQKLVQKLRLNPMIVLKYLGYSGAEIRKFAKEICG